LTARDGTPLPDRASDHGVGADLPAFVRDGALALRRPAALVDLERALADYRELGLGSLGVVVAEPALEALRARADAIMDGQHRDEDLFFQHDAESGKYERRWSCCQVLLAITSSTVRDKPRRRAAA
jgi:hypothetical protein